MPRAFLIKKHQGPKSDKGAPSSAPTKRPRLEASSDCESSESEAFLPSRVPLNSTSTDIRGPFDLSMKSKMAEERTPLTELMIPQRPLPSPLVHRSSLSPPGVGLVAPKPIKPVAKTPQEMAASRSPWQRMSPYLSYNYPLYPYQSDLYAMGSGYLGGSHPLVPPPLVPVPSSQPTSPPREERYSPFEAAPRSGDASPPLGNSPSPPITYYGWASDGQDSGVASSPSPSSEEGDSNQRRSATQTRYPCPDCSKSYSTYSGLSKHRLMHCSTQAKKSFSCKYCEKVYVSLGALKMHIRTHTLPCKCKLCGKAFSRPWLLQGHIRTHTGEKPFSCQHCSRAFADRSNLRAHLQTHSEVKKYRCKTCSKTFSRMSLLLKHEDGGCSGSNQNQPAT